MTPKKKLVTKKVKAWCVAHIDGTITSQLGYDKVKNGDVAKVKSYWWYYVTFPTSTEANRRKKCINIFERKDYEVLSCEITYKIKR